MPRSCADRRPRARSSTRRRPSERRRRWSVTGRTSRAAARRARRAERCDAAKLSISTLNPGAQSTGARRRRRGRRCGEPCRARVPGAPAELSELWPSSAQDGHPSQRHGRADSLAHRGPPLNVAARLLGQDLDERASANRRRCRTRSPVVFDVFHSRLGQSRPRVRSAARRARPEAAATAARTMHFSTGSRRSAGAIPRRSTPQAFADRRSIGDMPPTASCATERRQCPPHRRTARAILAA